MRAPEHEAAQALEVEADTVDDLGDPLRAAVMRDRANEMRARAQARRHLHSLPAATPRPGRR